MERSPFWLLLFFFQFSSGSSQEQLHYALFSPGPSGGLTTAGVVAAVELAEEMVNQNSSLLFNYTLVHAGVADTRCDGMRSRTLELFFEAVSPSSPTILGMIGSGCSIATALMAEIASHYSISQISYTSTPVSEEQADSSRATNFFQTIPSDAGFSPTIVSLCNFYNWKRVAFLTQQGMFFSEAMERFTRDLRGANITVKNRELNNRRLTRRENTTNIFFEGENYRVFFLNMHSSLARQILCAAYRRGLTYPRYIWITYGWYQDRWWSEQANSQPIKCSDQEMAWQVERAIALQLLPEATDSEATTDTGLSLNQFNALYHERLESNNLATFAAPFAYDAIWTLALALDKADDIITNRSKREIVSLTGCNMTTGSLVPLEKFTYENDLMGCVVKWCIGQTNFVGVTGIVKFDKVGSRMHSEVQVLQYRASEDDGTSLFLETFAKMTLGSTENISYVSNETTDSVFPGGLPSDGTPYTQTRTFHLELVIIAYILAALGLILCTACLLFNFTQRNKKVVRLTSPGLNYLILIGIYIFYVSIFFRLLPSTQYTLNAVRCNINIVFTNLGYCLTFGTLLAKMGRVYYIFHNPTTSKKALKDWHLAVIILAITGIGCILGVLHVAVPELKIDAILKDDMGFGTGRDEQGVEIQYITYQCSTEEGGYLHVLLVLTYIYFGLLQLIGIILAIQTRKVQVKVLNDSKHIAALIYLSSIVLVLLAVTTLVFNSYIIISETIFSGAFLFAATIFACLLFIPKMVSLYRDPKGEKIFEGSQRGTSVEGTLTGGRSPYSINHTIDYTQSDSVTIAQLQLRVRELERLLRENQMCSSGSDVGSSSLERMDSTSNLVDSTAPISEPSDHLQSE